MYSLTALAGYYSMGLSSNKFAPLQSIPSIGDIVLAKYEVDELYYRALVREINGG